VGGAFDDRPGPGLVIDDLRTPAATFDEVYRRERAKLVRTAYLIVRSQHVAEELVQDGFLRLHQHFDTVESPGGFLHTTVVRLCLTWLKRRGMERERLDRTATEPATGRPDEPMASADESDAMWAALAAIDPDRRAALVLRFYEDLPYEEIAEVLGCPIGTVRSRIHRGLDDLRKEVER
jgi:RNA polymerase sigma factor (sigma-70 family)